MNDQNTSKQKGAVLLVALLILSVLTVYGISSSKSVIMQQKMTANEQDVKLATLAAETGIYSGIEIIRSLTQAPADLPAQGSQDIFPKNSNVIRINADDFWEQADLTAVKDVDPTILSYSGMSAKYYVVHLGKVTIENANSIQSSELRKSKFTSGNGQFDSFMIVSRGKGLDPNTKRYIKAYYARDFDADTPSVP